MNLIGQYDQDPDEDEEDDDQKDQPTDDDISDDPYQIVVECPGHKNNPGEFQL